MHIVFITRAIAGYHGSSPPPKKVCILGARQREDGRKIKAAFLHEVVRVKTGKLSQECECSIWTFMLCATIRPAVLGEQLLAGGTDRLINPPYMRPIGLSNIQTANTPPIHDIKQGASLSPLIHSQCQLQV